MDRGSVFPAPLDGPGNLDQLRAQLGKSREKLVGVESLVGVEVVDRLMQQGVGLVGEGQILFDAWRWLGQMG